jgi:hypothetical protein
MRLYGRCRAKSNCPKGYNELRVYEFNLFLQKWRTVSHFHGCRRSVIAFRALGITEYAVGNEYVIARQPDLLEQGLKVVARAVSVKRQLRSVRTKSSWCLSNKH